MAGGVCLQVCVCVLVDALGDPLSYEKIIHHCGKLPSLFCRASDFIFQRVFSFHHRVWDIVRSILYLNTSLDTWANWKASFNIRLKGGKLINYIEILKINRESLSCLSDLIFSGVLCFHRLAKLMLSLQVTVSAIPWMFQVSWHQAAIWTWFLLPVFVSSMA